MSEINSKLRLLEKKVFSDAWSSEEKLKILESSTQELSKSVETQNGQQASQTAQQMGELMGLFSQLSAADRHSGN